MGRIRTIKPELPQSESMGRISRDARLTFILLWTLADDAGRLRGHPRLLASLLYPCDEDAFGQIEAWLDELISEGCIERYTEGGYQYIEISNWRKHQKIDRPSESRLPPNSKKFLPSANPREASSVDLEVDVDRERTRTVDLGAGGVSPHPQSPLPRTVDCAQAPARQCETAMHGADTTAPTAGKPAGILPSFAATVPIKTLPASLVTPPVSKPTNRPTSCTPHGPCSSACHPAREALMPADTPNPSRACNFTALWCLPVAAQNHPSQSSPETTTLGHEAPAARLTYSNIPQNDGKVIGLSPRRMPIQSLTTRTVDILHNECRYSARFLAGNAMTGDTRAAG